MKYTRIATIAFAIAAFGNSVQAQATLPPAQAEVRKIDLENKRITLKHGEIKNLNMPGMTMVFTAKDKGLLSNLKPGDKVKFMVVNEGGKMVVTDIRPAN